MRTLEMLRRTRRQALVLMIVGCVLAPPSAHAHFILVTPDSWMSQDVLGGPQKVGPCGNESGGTPTGIVGAYRPGDTITVTVNEVIYHPGHYRVALAVDDRSELPPEPAVTPKASDPCGSAVIEERPTFPILADNVLPHTQPFAGSQTFTVTLPTDVTCTKCTLQVLEFMSSHGAPCFYHHCADISIQADNPISTTSTTSPPGSMDVATTTTTIRSCSTARCSVEAVMQGQACGADTIPAAIQRKLGRAPELIARAETSPPGKARLLRKKAKHLLEQAGTSALRASRGRKPKLSAGCASAIKETTDRLADTK